MVRLRRFAILVFLLLALAALAPPAWQFVSTMPESDFRADPKRTQGLEWQFLLSDRSSLPPLPFATDDFEARVRVLRWGEHRGRRHGPFALLDAEGRVRVEGMFRYGERIGDWRAFDADLAKVLEGTYVADQPHGRWREPIGSYNVEVDYDEGTLVRWRLLLDGSALPWAEAPPEIEGRLALHLIGRGSDLPGSFVTLGLGHFVKRPGHRDPDWVEEGTWICLSIHGQLEGFGPMRQGQRVGQWTMFGSDGGIGRQEICDEFGIVQEDRREPPWYPAARSFVLPAPTDHSTSSASPPRATGELQRG